MKKLEQKVLEQFKKIMGKEVEDLHLIVSIPEDFGEYPDCNDIEIMENEISSRTWILECTKAGNIKSITEL